MSIVPNDWIDEGEIWHGGRPRPRPHCVRWGPSSPHQNGHSPQFLAHVCCGQTVGWIQMPLGTVVPAGLCPGDTVLDGDPCPRKNKGGIAPPILAHVCCGQRARWIRMPLGIEVGLRSGHIVLDGNPTRPKKGSQLQFFAHVRCGHTAGWYADRPRPRQHCVRWGPSSL